MVIRESITKSLFIIGLYHIHWRESITKSLYTSPSPMVSQEGNLGGACLSTLPSATETKTSASIRETRHTRGLEPTPSEVDNVITGLQWVTAADLDSDSSSFPRCTQFTRSASANGHQSTREMTSSNAPLPSMPRLGKAHPNESSNRRRYSAPASSSCNVSVWV